jgi:hypothetical protein
MPYRQNEPLLLCEVCKDPAVVRCRGCGRTYCDRHGSFKHWCADCELTPRAARVHRARQVANVALFGGGGVMGLVVMLALPFGIVPDMASLFVVAAGTYAVSRRLHHSAEQGPELLDQAHLRITPSTGDPEPAVSGSICPPPVA